MADLLAELTDYLATAANLVVGTTLFRGGVPDSSDAPTVSCVIPTGGTGKGESPLQDATFQIITRSSSLANCMTQARAIRAATLDSRQRPKIEVALATIKAKRIEPMQPPASIGPDAQGRIRTSFNIAVTATE